MSSKDEIRSIVLDAMAAGWTPELLWTETFWNVTPEGNKSGLATVMRPKDKIVEVTPDYITIKRPSGVTHKFYHPGRRHPWHEPSKNPLWHGGR
jgi:hypothetical protein